jgi:serine/threonine protein kinase
MSCAGCGTDIKGFTPFGHCPRCLVELGLSHFPEESPPLNSQHQFKARRFGEYELLDQLGRGGMGVVYRAYHLSQNRAVALKMVLDSQACSPIAIRRFELEAEAAARLNHPNIVPIYAIGMKMNSRSSA